MHYYFNKHNLIVSVTHVMYIGAPPTEFNEKYILEKYHAERIGFV